MGMKSSGDHRKYLEFFGSLWVIFGTLLKSSGHLPSGLLRKSLEVFESSEILEGHLRISLEIFGKSSEVFGPSSVILGNPRDIFRSLQVIVGKI